MHLVPSLIALAAFASLSASAAEPSLTAKERASVQQLAQSVERSCLAQRSDIFAQIERTLPGTRVLANSMDFAGYCGCMRQGVEARMTPDLLRHGTEAQAGVLMQQVGGTCAADALKAAFETGGCGEWVHALGQDRPLPQEAVKSVCRCTSELTLPLSSSAFAIAMEQTAQDLQDIQRVGKPKVARSASLLPRMQACIQNTEAKQ